MWFCWGGKKADYLQACLVHKPEFFQVTLPKNCSLSVKSGMCRFWFLHCSVVHVTPAITVISSKMHWIRISDPATIE